MAIAIQAYSEDLIPAVRNFNRRLAAGGVAEAFLFPEHHLPRWLPKINESGLYQEYFLAVEGGVVRGAYSLKFQNFYLDGAARPVVYYHSPISEGLVDKAYVSVGAHMLRNVLKVHPLVYALGMGGYDNPLPRMLKALDWSMFSVPFLFKVVHPGRFLREMQALRRTTAKRLLMDLAFVTGGGWIGLKVIQTFRGRHAPKNDLVTSQLVDTFEEWADEIWNACNSQYAMIAERSSESLNILYPECEKRFFRLKVTWKQNTLGWAVLMDTMMSADKYFGNLRVGSIADCLSPPQDAGAVLLASAKFLENRGVDIIVSNQSHTAWSQGLGAAGFLPGPSNFIFASSKKLTELLAPLDANRGRIHMTRGDGDGPIHL
jgi:hypothetical protein